MEQVISPDILRGHVNTMILKLLVDKDCYGYEICKLIFTNSNDSFELKEATLYSSLRRLEQDGLIQSYWGDETQGGRRKYYRTTDAGKEFYKGKKAHWVLVKTILDKLL